MGAPASPWRSGCVQYNPKFMSWGLSIGYGKPAEQALSSLVIVMIAVGLGVPVAVLFLGTTYVCVSKWRRSTGYQLIE